MNHSHRFAAFSGAVALTLLVSACGGGGDGYGSTAAPAAYTPAPVVSAPPPALGPNSTQPLVAPGYSISAPLATGDTATDGFAEFNYRRQQAGLSAVARNTNIDSAAAGHSNYQNVNDVITHVQDPNKPAFTGVDVLARLTAARYIFNATSGYAYGEVISASGDLSGVNNAEDLLTAIYHRFVILEPKFREAGAGKVGVSPTGYNYFTVDFAANGLTGGVGAGQVGVYPFPGQVDVVPLFHNHQESPDPVPNQDGVGYPVSVHADIDAALSVTAFTIQARGGALLPTKLLSHATDAETPASAAAIVPLTVLAPRTVYDVLFSGNVSGINISRIWSFTTR